MQNECSDIPRRGDSLCTNIKGCPEGRSLFGSGFPIGASSIPVGTRLSHGKSSVLYLCGADGSRNCSTPRKVWLQLRHSGGKGCPLRGSISARKRLADGAGKHCLSAVSPAEQRYIKAPICRCLPSVSEPPRQFPAQAVYRLSLHLLCPALAEMEMERRADQRVLDSIDKTIAVQQIGLLSGSQLVQRRIQFHQLFFLDIDLLRRLGVGIGYGFNPQQSFIL